MKDYKIFLVDDNTFSLHLYQEHLRKEGYNNLHLFEDGTSFLNKLSDMPKIVILDHGLPDINGLEVLRRIKRMDPNIYVIMLSSQEDLMVAVDSLKYGAFDYIMKDTNELEKLSEVLQRIERFDEILNQQKPKLIKRLFSAIF